MNTMVLLKNRASASAAHTVYLATIAVLTLSGFAQMPLFKRYYIADIPGLGWLAQFYTTHFLHYLAATVFIALTGYLTADYFLAGRRVYTLTRSGVVRIVLLVGLVISGAFLVIRNLSGVVLPPGFIIFLDLTHLGLVMVLLMVSLYCVTFKKAWVRMKN